MRNNNWTKVFILFAMCIFSYLLFNNGPRISYAQINRYDSGIVSVPATDTLLRSGTFLLKVLHCSNNTGSAATLTITDNATTPITYYPAVSMAANSILVANYGDPGIEMNGIRWTQGTSGAIECQISGKVN